MNVVIESALPLILLLTNNGTATELAYGSHRIGKVVESILAGITLSRLASQFIPEIGRRQSTCLGLGMGCVFAAIFHWNERTALQEDPDWGTPDDGVIGWMMNLTVKGLNTAGVVQMFMHKKWDSLSPRTIGIGFCFFSSSYTCVTQLVNYFAPRS